MILTFQPSEIQCYWCNGRMKVGGVIKSGGGINYISYFCKNCGGIAHFARHDDKKIKGFDVQYKYDEQEGQHGC